MTNTTVAASALACAVILGTAGGGLAEFAPAGNLKQVAPMRQESLKPPSLSDVPRDIPAPTSSLSGQGGTANAAAADNSQPMSPSVVSGYDPSGRRDPFSPVLNELKPGEVDPALPPLQRVGLTDMNLIAVIWGAYGYTAMVQTPDGNGYTVRKGTRMGPNNGVVSAITEKGIIVQERFTDVYGRKQEREYVKLLHPKEGLE